MLVESPVHYKIMIMTPECHRNYMYTILSYNSFLHNTRVHVQATENMCSSCDKSGYYILTTKYESTYINNCARMSQPCPIWSKISPQKKEKKTLSNKAMDIYYSVLGPLFSKIKYRRKAFYF